MTVISFRDYQIKKHVNYAKQMRFEHLANDTMDKLANHIMKLPQKNDEQEFMAALKGIINIVLDAEHQFTLRQKRG